MNSTNNSGSWKATCKAERVTHEKVAIANENMPAMPKAMDEAKGLITADYQNYLEKNWIGELRKKYPVTVNEQLLQTIIK